MSRLSPSSRHHIGSDAGTTAASAGRQRRRTPARRVTTMQRVGQRTSRPRPGAPAYSPTLCADDRGGLDAPGAATAAPGILEDEERRDGVAGQLQLRARVLVGDACARNHLEQVRRRVGRRTAKHSSTAARKAGRSLQQARDPCRILRPAAGEHEDDSGDPAPPSGRDAAPCRCRPSAAARSIRAVRRPPRCGLSKARRPICSVWATSAIGATASLGQARSATCAWCRRAPSASAPRTVSSLPASGTGGRPARGRLLEHDVRVRAADAERVDAGAARRRARARQGRSAVVHDRTGCRAKSMRGFGVSKCRRRRQLAGAAAPARP